MAAGFFSVTVKVALLRREPIVLADAACVKSESDEEQ